MTLQDKINRRFFKLTEALEKCTNEQDCGRKPIFTLVERIFINQERGQLLQGHDEYKQIASLELKIKTNS